MKTKVIKGLFLLFAFLVVPAYAQLPPPPASLSFTANTYQVASGGAATLQWTSVGMANCTTSGAWSGAQTISGTYDTGPLYANTTYNLTCVTPTSVAYPASVTIIIADSGTITTPIDPTAPAPDLTITATPSVVASGASSSLSWNSTNTIGCTASGDWTGTKAISGILNITNITVNKSFTLACSGINGSTISRTATLAIDAASSLTFTGTPTDVATGQSSNLNWSSTNMTSCTASGGWTGSKSLSGSFNTGALSTSTTYTLACTGVAGQAPEKFESTLFPSVGWTTGGSTNWFRDTAQHSEGVASAGSGAILDNQENWIDFDYTFASSGSVSFYWKVSSEGGWDYLLFCLDNDNCTRGNDYVQKISGMQEWAQVTKNVTAGAHSFRWKYAKDDSNRVGSDRGWIDNVVINDPGKGGNSTKSVTVNVIAPPTLSLSSDKTNVATNGSAVLTWTSANTTSCTASNGWTGTKTASGTETISGITATKIYTLACAGNDGTTITKDITVNLIPAPTLSLGASPTSVPTGGSTTLSWSSTNTTACTASGGWSGPTASTSGTQAVSNINASTTFNLACTGTDGTTITRNVTVSLIAPPALTFSADKATVPTGGSAVLTWNAANSTTCNATGGWSGSKIISGTQTITNITATTTYSLACTGNDGTTTTKNVVITLIPPPTLTLSSDKTSVATNGAAVLTWTSANTTSCTATDGWTGTKVLSGTETIGSITATKTYTLTCVGTDGTSVNRSVTVSLISPPTMTLSASPTTVATNGSTTLSWTSTNTSTCTASGGWTGTKSTNSTQMITGIADLTTFNLACTGNDGTQLTRSVTISVIPPPTLTFTADKTSIPVNGSVSLNWNATNVTSCTASGGWTGSKNISGTQAVTGITVTTSYTLTCNGNDGTTVNKSLTVTAIPAPSVTLTAQLTQIKVGETTRIDWLSTNVESCTASGKWTGSLPTSGTYTTAALTDNSTYNLDCLGLDGTHVNKSVTITVLPAPTLTLSATSTNILAGQTTTLNWTATNVTACTAAAGWTGTKAATGTETTAVLNVDTTFTLNCAGIDGTTISKSVAITVTIPPPMLEFGISGVTPNSISVPEGESRSITWMAANVSTCTASGGWTGTKPATGSFDTGALTQNVIYTLSCVGSNGTNISKNITITVILKPVINFSSAKTEVRNGEETSITWTATNVTTCTASGGWTGTKPTTGTEMTGALGLPTTYTLTCTGTDGSTAQKTVTILISTPVITIFPGICHMYTDQDSFPVTNSFAPSFNVLSSTKELLMKVLCHETSVDASLGNGNRNLYIYNSGYVYTNQSWQPVTFNGDAPVANSWFAGNASVANYPMTKEQLVQRSLLLSYFCSWDGFEWKCGCQNETCTNSLWSLQGFQAENSIN